MTSVPASSPNKKGKLEKTGCQNERELRLLMEEVVGA
jgi:hypothetical protein